MNQFVMSLPNLEVGLEIMGRDAFKHDDFQKRVDVDGNHYLIIETHKSIEDVEQVLHEMVDTKLVRNTLKVYVPPAPRQVKVVVDVSNGLFKAVHSDAPTKVMVVDYEDTENIRATILGKETWAGVLDGEYDPGRVSRAFQDWEDSQPF